MATEFTEETVKEFLIANGCRVKNTELVTHFKRFLNDSARKDEMREKFKNYVNTLATIKLDEISHTCDSTKIVDRTLQFERNKDKILVLKKKYLTDSGGGMKNWDVRAQSEPPAIPTTHEDRPDGAAPSKVKSDGNLSASDLQLSSSTLASTAGSTSLDSNMSTASTRSLSSIEQEESNASVLSVKERAQHLNRIESETDILRVSTASLGAIRKKDHRKIRDPDGDSNSSGSAAYLPLNALEKEWLVKCSSSEYHLINELLSKHPDLVAVKEYSSEVVFVEEHVQIGNSAFQDYRTALHWAAKRGRPEVIKMLMSKSGVDINQRTGYTPLHLAAIQGHEEIIELLVQGFKADPNMRDFSGKKAKQYLRNSAASRVQQLLVSSKLSSKSGSDKSESGFMRNSGNRRSNRESAIKVLIRASTGAMKQTVLRSGWGSSEDVLDEPSPRCSPRHSAEPSPVIRRRKGSFKERDRKLMPPPGTSSKHSMKPKHSVSKESLHTEDKKLSMLKQVSRSESEPNLGEITQPSKSTFI